MNPEDINKIRDLASELKESNPLAAYKLFNIALKYRPEGGYLIKEKQKLKKKLNIKHFVIIGNCQATPLAELIEFKNSTFIVDEVIKAYLYKATVQTEELFKSTDYIITQNISNKFLGINTNFLKKKYFGKLIVVPGLFFKGEHPDWFYPPKTEEKRLQSPLGDYHNQTVIDCYISGLSIEQTIENLNSYEYNFKKYQKQWKLSIEELKIREAKCDTIISDVIEKTYIKGKKQFHSFNHPNKKLMNIHCNRILNYIGLKHNEVASKGECLYGGALPHNIIAEVISKSQDIKLDYFTFVSESFLIYNNNKSVIDEYKKCF